MKSFESVSLMKNERDAIKAAIKMLGPQWGRATGTARYNR